MIFRTLIVLSAATAASAGFAEDTCVQPEWVPQPDNSASPTTKVRCCAGAFGDGNQVGKYAACDTSSCINNFAAKNRNCFNYGAPQNGGQARRNQGSAICPYADEDQAICDTSYYNDMNGVNCRHLARGKNVHCLGKVKCNTVGVTKWSNNNGVHSDGTADLMPGAENVCYGAMSGYGAGDDCFYDGASDNWKVCKGTPEGDEPLGEPRAGEGSVEPTVPTEDPDYQPDDPMTSGSNPGTKGDPHFKTHGGEMYDFHGGCDLVLIDNPGFLDGRGMLVHIRTKIVTWWSYVESAAVRIGDTTVEIRGGQKSEWLFVNGEPNQLDMEDNKFYRINFDGFFIRYFVKEGNGEVHVHYGPNKFFMKTYKDFVKVDLATKDNDNFANSQGLLGSFPTGERLARDQKTPIEDVNEFGQEWQVRPDEPQLFRTYDADWVVPAGEKCAMPVETAAKASLRQRRLADGISMEDAEKACAHLEDAMDKNACIFDVIATQDMSVATGGVW